VLRGKARSDDEKWQEVKRQIAVRNIFLLQELREILLACNRAGIKVLVLKGAALTESLYPHLGVRQFADLDLLFQPEDMPGVIEIFRSSGYQPLILEADQVQTWTERFGWLGMIGITYIKRKELTIMADAHWALGCAGTYLDRLDIKGMWQRARREKVAGVDALILSPEDLLIYLCLHLYKHLPYNSLTSACDIAELLKQSADQIDWEAFISRVLKAKLCLPIRFTLEQVSQNFPCPIPPWVWEKLNNCPTGIMERLALRIGKSPGKSHSSGRYILACFLNVLGTGRKLGYLRRIFLPDRKFIIWRYGRRKSLPLCYIMHILRVLKAAGLAMLPGKRKTEVPDG